MGRLANLLGGWKKYRPGLPTSLTEMVVKEVVYTVKAFVQRKAAYPMEVQVAVPGKWLPLHLGAKLDVQALRHEVLQGVVAICDDDLKHWVARSMRLDLHVEPAAEQVQVKVKRYKPINGSRLPFALPS